PSVHPTLPTIFPYTTLFRSRGGQGADTADPGPRALSGVLDHRELGLLVGVRGAQRGDDGGAAVAGQRHLQAVLDHLGDLTALADGRVGRGAGPEGALTGDGEGAPVV